MADALNTCHLLVVETFSKFRTSDTRESLLGLCGFCFLLGTGVFKLMFNRSNMKKWSVQTEEKKMILNYLAVNDDTLFYNIGYCFKQLFWHMNVVTV